MRVRNFGLQIIVEMKTDMKTSVPRDEPQDKGYAWVICLCCFMINHFSGGMRNCQGNIYVILQKNSGLGREVASWPNTCLAFTVSLSALFSGVLNYYFSWRKVLNGLALLGTLGFLVAYIGPEDIITTCIAEIIIGFSIGPVFPTLIRISASYFVKRRALAQNISFGANAVSSISYPLLLDKVEEIYGLRGSWLILCALYIQSFVFIALARPLKLRPTPDETSVSLLKALPSNGNAAKTYDENNLDIRTQNNESQKILHMIKNKENVIIPKQSPAPALSLANYLSEIWELIVNPIFVAFLFTVSTDFTLFMSSFFILIDHGIDLGMTPTGATTLLMAISLGDFCSRLVAGWIIDQQLMSLLKFFALTCSLSGLVYIFIGFAATANWLYVGCFLNGVVYCFTSALRMLMSTNLFDARKGATITGIIMFLLGLFVILLPTLIGVFREELGSYSYLYLLFGCLDLSLVPVSLILNNVIMTRQKKQLSINSSVL